MSDDDDDKIDQLERLASLRERGLLSAEEFATEKSKVLNANGAPSTSVQATAPIPSTNDDPPPRPSAPGTH